MVQITPSPSKPGQESVWDYPRPPALERTTAHIVVRIGGRLIADSTNAMRFLETSHPPSYYLPRGDVEMDYLEPLTRRSLCEWKGQARYFDIVVGDQRAEGAAWSYPVPFQNYAELEDRIAFYVHPLAECFVDDERALAQPGNFYGGWVTSKVTGPFKGLPGSWGW